MKLITDTADTVLTEAIENTSQLAGPVGVLVLILLLIIMLMSLGIAYLSYMGERKAIKKINELIQGYHEDALANVQVLQDLGQLLNRVVDSTGILSIDLKEGFRETRAHVSEVETRLATRVQESNRA